jgi:hypothetical protein
LKAIDIENDEYMFWDANGNGLKILIEKERVIGFANAENKSHSSRLSTITCSSQA